MRLKYVISVFTIAFLFATGCGNVNSQETSETGSNDSQQVGDISSHLYAAHEEPAPFYIPMPPGFWMNDPLGGIWSISFKTYDNQVPPEEMWVSITHADRSGIGLYMQGNGYLIDSVLTSYFYEFPSHQPLQDLVEYMDLHQGVFFDYSEFAGADPGSYILPAGTDEFFEFTILDPTNADQYFCIAKGVVPGQPVPPEIQYVMDELRSWRDEILAHPE